MYVWIVKSCERYHVTLLVKWVTVLPSGCSTNLLLNPWPEFSSMLTPYVGGGVDEACHRLHKEKYQFWVDDVHCAFWSGSHWKGQLCQLIWYHTFSAQSLQIISLKLKSTVTSCYISLKRFLILYWQFWNFNWKFTCWVILFVLCSALLTDNFLITHLAESDFNPRHLRTYLLPEF